MLYATLEENIARKTLSTEQQTQMTFRDVKMQILTSLKYSSDIIILEYLWVHEHIIRDLVKENVLKGVVQQS